METPVYDNKILNAFNNMLQYMPYFFEDDVSFEIANTEKYLKVQFNLNLDLGLIEGDRIPEGGAVLMAIKSNKIIIKNVPKEVYEVPFRSCAIPAHNEQGIVAGCIVIGISLLKRDELINLLQDVSDRKSIAEIQSKYTLKLEKSNIKLKKRLKKDYLQKINYFILYIMIHSQKFITEKKC